MPNFGFDHRTREADLRRMYSGAPEAEALLRHYGIHYVWIGPEERSNYGARDKWFSAHFPLVIQQGSHSVYEITR